MIQMVLKSGQDYVRLWCDLNSNLTNARSGCMKAVYLNQDHRGLRRQPMQASLSIRPLIKQVLER